MRDLGLSFFYLDNGYDTTNKIMLPNNVKECDVRCCDDAVLGMKFYVMKW